jgi:histidinol-phosphate/aromatic aminotransferase/cobyric acid decarboxylase-like protein
MVERLAAHRQPWSVNSLACAALTTCAGDRDTPRRIAAEVAVARAQLASGLAQLPGVRVWDGAANFLLFRVADGPGAVAALRERSIAVRPARSFPGLDEHYLRTAVRTPNENAQLVDTLADALA